MEFDGIGTYDTNIKLDCTGDIDRCSIPGIVVAWLHQKDLCIDSPHYTHNADDETGTKETDDDGSLPCFHLKLHNHWDGDQDDEEVADEVDDVCC